MEGFNTADSLNSAGGGTRLEDGRQVRFSDLLYSLDGRKLIGGSVVRGA